jgi:hypothetical protein
MGQGMAAKMSELIEGAYLACRARLNLHEAWVDTQRGKNGWASYRPEDMPAHVPNITNEERAGVELYEWLSNPPDRYFLYIDAEKYKIATGQAGMFLGSYDRLAKDGATNWTGLALGNVRFGRQWRDNFGGVRVPVTVYGNNGVHYIGTYFKSSGDYARIRKAARVLCGPRKGQKQ